MMPILRGRNAFFAPLKSKKIRAKAKGANNANGYEIELVGILKHF
jgi:hypothetical protein